jgi:hypothetical protein
MSDIFQTQLIYRKGEVEFVLGYVAEFAGEGVIRKYKKSDPNYMYKGFRHSYKWRRGVGQVPWSRKWCTHTQAVEALLIVNDLDPIWGSYHVVPIPEKFKNQWHHHSW